MRQPKPSCLDTTREGQWLTFTKGPPRLPSRDLVKRHLESYYRSDMEHFNAANKVPHRPHAWSILHRAVGISIQSPPASHSFKGRLNNQCLD